MLELDRPHRQSVIIGDDIEITVLSISHGTMKIGIQAPRELPILRKELYVEIAARHEARHVAHARHGRAS